jgi:hypothetical protein
MRPRRRVWDVVARTLGRCNAAVMRWQAVAVLLALGCGGRDALVPDPQPTGAAGGAAGDPGGGPPPISGKADGGGGGLVCVLPSCVATLVTACPTTGVRCRTDGSLATGQTRQCYDDGVTVSSTLGLTGALVKVAKPDGSPCYSIAGSFLGATSATFQVVNAAGATVATGMVQQSGDSSQILLTCTNASTSVMLPLACTPLAGALSGGGCTPGSCP